MIHQFEATERLIHIPHTERRENDAEHSYQLTMVAWYIISSNNLNLNLELVLKYALVHDLVEVYAGDVWFYRSEKENVKKKKKEEEAIKQLKKDYPDFKDLHEYIEKYEKREDNEACFVYALDKILPVINLYLDGGRAWREHKVTYSQLITDKTEKMTVSEHIKPYFEQLVILLSKNKYMFHVEQK